MKYKLDIRGRPLSFLLSHKSICLHYSTYVSVRRSKQWCACQLFGNGCTTSSSSHWTWTAAVPLEFRPRKCVGASRYGKTCWLLFSWTENHISFTVDQMSVVTTSRIDEIENDNIYAATGEMCELTYREGCES